MGLEKVSILGHVLGIQRQKERNNNADERFERIYKKTA